MWRLPKREELRTLQDGRGQFGLPGMENVPHWTCEGNPRNLNEAWFVGANPPEGASSKQDQVRVRSVRGSMKVNAQLLTATNRYVERQDCYFDSATGLEWEKKDMGPVSWYTAMGRASRQRPYSGRGFERVNDPTVTVALPSRGTQFSAGYDIFSPETVDIQPGASYDLVTGIKAYMLPDEVLFIFIRSSSGKAGLELKNKVAVIDCDYFDNPGNEGNITLMLKNTGDTPITVNKGGKIAQGIFTKHLLADGDDLNGTKASRSGGIGSTGI